MFYEDLNHCYNIIIIIIMLESSTDATSATRVAYFLHVTQVWVVYISVSKALLSI